MDSIKKIVSKAVDQAEKNIATGTMVSAGAIITASKPNQANELVAFVVERVALFHNENKDVFAQDKTTNIVRPIEGRQFRDWLTSSFYEFTDKSVRDQSFREALSTLSGIGRFKGELHDVHVRVALQDDCYYLDLCQPSNNRVVKITPGHWDIIESNTVRFVRAAPMQSLPDPIKGGDISKLWKICNIPKSSRLLVLAWMGETLRPDTPYPVLEILGEQGTAKSTTQTALRRVIDPSSSDLRSIPKCIDDVFVGAAVNHIMSYENVSYLSQPMQDACCIIATGGGYAKRKLYSDAEECVIQTKNPIIMNGIAAIVTAQDLIDRAISVDLPLINKRTETTILWSDFEHWHGEILGGLLDIIAKALQLLPAVNLPKGENPRLVEFVRFGMAIAEATGKKGLDFIKQFNTSRQEAIARTIDASPVASSLIDWFEYQGKVSMTLSAKELFMEVEKRRPQGTEAWPKSAKGFADALRRAAPALRQLGIECQCLGKQGSYVKWKIFQGEKLPDHSLQCLDVLPEQDIKTLKTSVQEISSQYGDLM